MEEKKYQYGVDWDNIYMSPESKPWETGEIASALMDFFDNSENKTQYKDCRIIDVGCGDGRLCEKLAELGYTDVTGLDVSEYKINECNKNIESKVQYIHKDIVNDDISDLIKGDGERKKFDIVVCWFVLHHILPCDVNKFIVNLFNLCKSDGLLILSFRLPTDGCQQVPSHFSTLHSIQLYNVDEVKNMFAPYFSIVIKDKKGTKDLLNEPDIYGDVYRYCVMKMKKKTIKKELSDRINIFKRKYILPDSGIYDSSCDRRDKPQQYREQTQKLIELLDSFSKLSRDVDKLPESDYLEIFQSLFRNVSRFICKRIIPESKKGKRSTDVIILKMDTQTVMYSATRFRKLDEKDVNRPHCRFNNNVDEKDVVRSRAYDLFYQYLDFTKSDKVRFTLHSHFSEDPKLRHIAFDWDNKNHQLYISELEKERKEFKSTADQKKYQSFLKAVLDGTKYNKKGVEKGKIYDTFEEYLSINGTISSKKTKSFSCFNLGIPGFESWGSLMIEGVDSDVSTVKEWFYDKNNHETGLLRDIKNIVFILKKIDYDYYENLNAKKIKIQAIKSAVAALMARNMSHNLGSHYLTNTKNYFRKRVDEIAKQHEADMERLGADYRGNVHMLQYVKERMDFIATVVSGDHYPYGPLNFKAQFFDVLTEDDHEKRHGKNTQNFLLKYLVFSERLTRWAADTKDLLLVKSNPYHKISLQVELNNPEEFGLKTERKIYTGKNIDEIISCEKDIKAILSTLELAVPGGLMARHAFFTIIENIIRNSAKHSKSEDDLVLTLDLIKHGYDLKIAIHDNRRGGYDVKKEIEKNFETLKILKGDDNSVDKESKGLKEMLICAIWLKNEDVANRLYDIQRREGGEKLRAIKNYIDVSIDKEANLCYTINVPLYKACHKLERDIDFSEDISGIIKLRSENVVNIHSDIIVADKDYAIDEGKQRKLSDIFPRFVALDKGADPDNESDFKTKWQEAIITKDREKIFALYNEQHQIKSIISVDSNTYSGGDISESGWCNVEVRERTFDDDRWDILFKRHLDSGTTTKEKKRLVKKAKGRYLESVSGDNYTSTIATREFLLDPVNRYKVAEAANARIAIIDERIFEDYATRWSKDKALEQSILGMKGVYLFNLDSDHNNIIQLSGKRLTKKCEVDFVTIHLGLIEKYIKNSKIKKLISLLTNKFGNNKKKTFFAIHSGRGNFSPELENELRNYPFISLSALEAAFYDSKYFLAQIFKNTNYYGKGNFNNE